MWFSFDNFLRFSASLAEGIKLLADQRGYVKQQEALELAACLAGQRFLKVG